jgi:hypothetical protein
VRKIGDPRAELESDLRVRVVTGPRLVEDVLMPDFVQFIHPGGEHGPDRQGQKAWNLGEHRRKFLRVDGRYIEQLGDSPTDSPLVLWGEWEPESDVAPISDSVAAGPRWLHQPYYVRPEAYKNGDLVHQNTDPFVFGDRFLYTLCRQWRGSTQRPTLLRDLEPGSLILFGSLKGGEFVLDTAFVVAEGVLHDFHSWPNVLDGAISETYIDVTMHPTYAWGEGAELRLYSGAMADDPLDGMFSFVPCLPASAGANGFARPAIKLNGFVAQGLMMGFKTTRGLPAEKIATLWNSVTEQVIDADLALGTSLALPERRDA